MKRGLEVNLCTKTYFFIRFNSSKSSSYMKLRVWLFFVCSYIHIYVFSLVYIYVQMVCMMIYCIYRDGESSYRMYLSYICTYIREDDEYIRYTIQYILHTHIYRYTFCVVVFFRAYLLYLSSSFSFLIFLFSSYTFLILTLRFYCVKQI